MNTFGNSLEAGVRYVLHSALWDYTGYLVVVVVTHGEYDYLICEKRSLHLMYSVQPMHVMYSLSFLLSHT